MKYINRNISVFQLEYHVSLVLDQYISNIQQILIVIMFCLGSQIEVTLIYFALFSALSFV